MAVNNKVTNILLDRIIKTAKEEGKLPWEQPWKYCNAFNYFTKHEYRGINRWLIPAGEYMTKKQINTYNKEHGTNYRFKKGIKWEYVLFCKTDEKMMPNFEVPDDFKDTVKGITDEQYHFLGFHGGYTWFANHLFCIKRRVIRTYHQVADRQWFVDENGECLPSKIDLGEVQLVKQEPKLVFNNYINREGIKLVHQEIGSAFYSPDLDKINLPPDANFKSEEDLYATAFHEAGHSTGHQNRLDRKGITGWNPFGSQGYSREELVAELCSALCCAETGIANYESQHEKLFENHAAYVQSWLNTFERFKTDKDADDIVYVCSDAEKAFQFILSATDKDMLEDLKNGNDGGGNPSVPSKDYEPVSNDDSEE